MDVLPDALQSGLKIVFAGTGVGDVSARRGAYYAGPTNRFWRTLHNVGLTNRLFAPAEYEGLLDFGLGLTDIAKRASGTDNEISPEEYDVDGFRRKIQKSAPSFVCFNGKKAASLVLRRSTGAISYGLQGETIGSTRLFVAPSTSGAAGRYWSIEPWRELADLARDCCAAG